ncbi:acyl-CoA dehydrogenase [uncultured Pseudacidovorax sp.]|uniref:acyl-CoA dehydrogenase family protein n=1 Tax=uncultured Pseudacidovorax sp. TaxID=679313 RepID=UPI0025D6BB03|nr:acyl-CoA dehydrogenase [uncultured Pseudacidovorax sp.]
MDFSFTEEQRALQDAVSRYLRQSYGFLQREARRLSERGWDDGTWRALGELGVLALPFDQQHGGLGGGTVETMLVAQELGRAMVMEPWFASVVLAGGTLAALGGRDAERWLPSIASGEQIFALALEEPDTAWRPAHSRLTATRDGEGYRVDGSKILVEHGASADVLLVLARTSGAVGEGAGLSLFAIAADHPGIRRSGYRRHDGVPVADLVFDQVRLPASALLGTEGAALAAVEQAIDRAIAVQAAEALGLTESLLALTIEHLQTRQQFGRPLATFQVLQHGAVDMLVAIEQVRSMAWFAAGAATGQDAAARRRAMSSVKYLVGRNARMVAQMAVQLHGAIGLTDECVVSHAFRRLMSLELQFGDAQHHLAAYAVDDRVGAQP